MRLLCKRVASSTEVDVVMRVVKRKLLWLSSTITVLSLLFSIKKVQTSSRKLPVTAMLSSLVTAYLVVLNIRDSSYSVKEEKDRMGDISDLSTCTPHSLPPTSEDFTIVGESGVEAAKKNDIQACTLIMRTFVSRHFWVM